MEKRSSAPPNPPAGLDAGVVVVVFVVEVVVVDETGAALAQPPKSSSAVTVGVGLGAAPQPAPISLAVSVSGTFITGEEVDAAGAGSGAGSGVFHALPPQGSMLAENMLLDEVVVAAGTAGLGAGTVGPERLKADFISCCGETEAGWGGAAVGAGGGEERPKRSLDKDDDGGLGLVVGEAKPPNPKSCPFDEMEVVRDCGLGADMVGEVKPSKKPPPAEPVGDVTFGAAGGDLALEKLVRFANADGFSAGLAGGEVADGKLSPLKASVNPPMFEDVDGAGGDAMSPKEF